MVEHEVDHLVKRFHPRGTELFEEGRVWFETCCKLGRGIDDLQAEFEGFRGTP